MKNNVLLIAVLFFVAAVSCKKDSESSPYPTDGLISYFNFNDNLKDVLGNTPDGINYGGATFSNELNARSVTFNGTSQYVQFNRHTYRNGNNVSVSVWFKKSGSTGSGMFFIACDDFFLLTNDAGNAGMAISVPSTNSAYGAISEDVWTHMVGTYDGTDIKVYINGELKEIKNHPGDISGVDKLLTIGAVGSSYWGGSVDDLFIYNRVLTQKEVTQLSEYVGYLTD